LEPYKFKVDMLEITYEKKTQQYHSVIDWNIIMYYHEGVKIVKVIWSLSIFFHMSNFKSWSPKQYEDKKTNMHHPNQFIASQNLFYSFFKWISNVIFSPSSSVFEVLFQGPSTLQKVKIAMDILAQNLE